jgi:hypothetical protein
MQCIDIFNAALPCTNGVINVENVRLSPFCKFLTFTRYHMASFENLKKSCQSWLELSAISTFSRKVDDGDMQCCVVASFVRNPGPNGRCEVLRENLLRFPFTIREFSHLQIPLIFTLKKNYLFTRTVPVNSVSPPVLLASLSFIT